MNRFLSISLILLTCWAVGCKKAKGPVNGNSVQPNNNLDSTVSITAIINGVTWHTDSAYAYYVKNSGDDSSKIALLITATNFSNPRTSMTFNIAYYTGPGTYAIDPPLNTLTYYSGNDRHFATHGVITMGSDTAYALRGTFSFTADSVDATNGVFDVARP